MKKDIPTNNYDGWKTPIIGKDSFEKLSTYEALLYLCRFGHLAPSSHNTQPWRFVIDQNTNSIYIYLDRKFVLTASDTHGRQAVISVGCAIQNIITAAQYFNFYESIKINKLKKEHTLPYRESDNIARYSFVGGIRLGNKIDKLVSRHKKLLESILSRKVVRAEYDVQFVIPKHIIKIIEKVPDGQHASVKLLTAHAIKMLIAEFQGQADNFVINSKKFSRELGEWFLPNDTDSGLGMPGIGFGLQDDEAVRIHEGLFGQQNLRPDDGLKFSLAGKKGIETSSLIGIITCPKDDAEHWIHAGLVFEKIFLILNNEGINVAVHAGIVEVGLINRMFCVALGIKGSIAVIFRAGKVKNKEHAKRLHSPRLPIESMLLAQKP